LSHIRTREKIFLLASLEHENFYVDQYGFVDSNLQHYGDINHDHNFWMSHILCLVKTNNRLCINCGAQIYKFIKIFIYFNLWWLWIIDDVWHTHAFGFFQYNN